MFKTRDPDIFLKILDFLKKDIIVSKSFLCNTIFVVKITSIGTSWNNSCKIYLKYSITL